MLALPVRMAAVTVTVSESTASHLNCTVTGIMMSCPSWQRHKTGCRRSPIRTPPLPSDAFGALVVRSGMLFTNSRGILLEAAANPRRLTESPLVWEGGGGGACPVSQARGRRGRWRGDSDGAARTGRLGRHDSDGMTRTA